MNEPQPERTTLKAARDLDDLRRGHTVPGDPDTLRIHGGAPLGSARLATPDHYPMILLRKTLGDMRGSIDLWYDDDDRPGEGSAESSEIADDDFPALALDIPPGVSGIDNGPTIVEYESDQDVGDVLPDQHRRATREDESASDIPGERADDTTEERDTNLEGDGRAFSGLSPEQVEAAEKELGDLIRGVRLVYSAWTKRSLVSGHGSQRAGPGSSLPSGRPPAACSRKSASIS